MVTRSARAALALLVGLVPPAAGQSAFPWPPEDRTVVADFSSVTALAATVDRVFVAARDGLAIWRPLDRRWEVAPPPPRPDALREVFAALVDPLDQSVYLVRRDGWFRYQPNLRTWDEGFVPGLRFLAVDHGRPDRGVFFRTTAGWLQLPPGALQPIPSSPPAQPVAPATAEEALQANPALRANQARLLTDRRLRTVRFTAAARAVDRPGWYLGTSGAGLYFVPEGSPLADSLPFGLPGDVVSALYSAPGGVWAVTDRTVNNDAAVTFVAEDLTRFLTLSGPPATGLRFDRARDIVAQGRDLWLATDAGALQLASDGGRLRQYDQTRGLPDGQVLDIATRRGTLAVGTARGVALIDDSLRVRPLARDFVDPALAVALSAAADTVWVGTPIGLFLVRPGDDDLTRPADQGPEPFWRTPIYDLAWLADTLVAATEEGLVWRTPSGEWHRGPPLAALLGRLRLLAVDRDGIWVAGSRGVSHTTTGQPSARVLLAGRDLPGEPLALAVDEHWLWIGTNSGLVRFRLGAVR